VTLATLPHGENLVGLTPYIRTVILSLLLLTGLLGTSSKAQSNIAWDVTLSVTVDGVVHTSHQTVTLPFSSSGHPGTISTDFGLMNVNFIIDTNFANSPLFRFNTAGWDGCREGSGQTYGGESNGSWTIDDTFLIGWGPCSLNISAIRIVATAPHSNLQVSPSPADNQLLIGRQGGPFSPSPFTYNVNTIGEVGGYTSSITYNVSIQYGPFDPPGWLTVCVPKP
jgi:hypothetical protein